VEGEVMKKLYDGGKIKCKEIFRREIEFTHEIIQFIEKKTPS
jgi:hypothetical protein